MKRSFDPISYGKVGSIDIGTHSDDQFIGQVEVIDDFTLNSKFDFNDGLGDDLLEVGFHVKPILLKCSSVIFTLMKAWNTMEDFWKSYRCGNWCRFVGFCIWPFTAPNGIDGPREPFEYDLPRVVEYIWRIFCKTLPVSSILKHGL